MARPLSLCVFCGSSQGNDPKHRLQAARLGRLIAKRGIRLVYGGAKVGLMGVLADAALEAGGQVTGVVPRHLTRAEVAHEALSEMIVVESMHERKRKMFELADGSPWCPDDARSGQDQYNQMAPALYPTIMPRRPSRRWSNLGTAHNV